MYDDSFTTGQPLISVTGPWRILSYVHREKDKKIDKYFTDRVAG